MSVLDAISRAANPSAPTADATVPEIAEVLSNDRRCFVIDALEDTAPLTLSALAEQLAEVEHGPAYEPRHRKAAYVCLYQTHFQTLKEAGVVVDREDRRHVFDRGPEFEGYAAALAALREHAGGDGE